MGEVVLREVEVVVRRHKRRSRRDAGRAVVQPARGGEPPAHPGQIRRLHPYDVALDPREVGCLHRGRLRGTHRAGPVAARLRTFSGTAASGTPKKLVYLASTGSSNSASRASSVHQIGVLVSKLMRMERIGRPLTGGGASRLKPG